jgi:hypothetical protein
MDYKMVRRIAVVAGLAVLATGCSKSPTSPTNPGAGGNNNNATVTSVTIAGNVMLSEGATSQLTATANMSDGSSQDVSSQAVWQSSEPTVATVSATGLVSAVKTGNTDISATYRGQTGRVTVLVSAALYTVRVSGLSVTALSTCDDVTQGLSNGEFAVRVRAITSNGGTVTLTQTAAYPGSTSNPSTHSLGRNQSRSLGGARSFTMSGAPGQSLRIEFSSTEWDSQIVLIPPSTRNIHDSRMSNRSRSRTHAFSNGSFGSLGSNSVTLGNSSCGIRLNYSVSATKQ